MADKDLVARAGVPTRYGSRAFAENMPTVSDDMALLFGDAGGVSLGKTNTPEFGLTAYTETLVAPPARDPWNPELGAGGSSGGAAVAVAMGMLPFAPASDGGGSIRIPAPASVWSVSSRPAADCPSGRASTISPGSRSADPLRETSQTPLYCWMPWPRVARTTMPRAPGVGPFLASALRPDGRFRVGVTTVSPWDDAESIELDPSAAAAVRVAVGMLGGLGHDVEEFDWRPHAYADMFTTLWRASAARIGVEDDRLHLVEPLTAWLVRSGRALGARELANALAAATVFERETITAFAPFDAVLTPALAQSPRPIGWFDATDARRNFSQQVRYTPYTSFVNVAGLPAIVLPVSQD